MSAKAAMTPHKMAALFATTWLLGVLFSELLPMAGRCLGPLTV